MLREGIEVTSLSRDLGADFIPHSLEIIPLRFVKAPLPGRIHLVINPGLLSYQLVECWR